MTSLKKNGDHRTKLSGWLRAAILGANDGILSTSSLILGVAGAHAAKESILVAGVAGCVAGALSMATGEYVSVSSQADIEKTELAKERKKLEKNNAQEHEELTSIYVSRGVDRVLAKKVANQLMEYDALDAHARDELGISVISKPRPLQAAITSAITFSIGAALPLLTVLISPQNKLPSQVFIASLIFLAVLGAFGAHVGGANVIRAMTRVAFWGALAMGLTTIIGNLFTPVD